MKKKFLRSVVIPLLFAVCLGFYGAKIAYEFYKLKTVVTEVSHNAYAIQYGVYTNPETLTSILSDLENYVISLEDGKYYVYLGFTTNYKNLSKIRNMYEDSGTEVYVREVFIDNQEFVSSLEQYDILLDSVNLEEDIVSVNKAILSSYDEIILGK